MLWIRFDESDRQTPAPAFCLPGFFAGKPAGQTCLRDYHGDSSLESVQEEVLQWFQCVGLQCPE